jgi:hypothetical protein
MTYVGYVRSLGYKVKISKTPAFADPAYLRTVQIGGYLSEKAMAGQTPGDDGKPPKRASAGADLPPGGDQGPSRTAGSTGSSGSFSTMYDVLPQGVLHPAVRKAQRELDAKLREIKARPFAAEVIKVDPVRWATGRMGRLQANGTISGALVEGQSTDAFIAPPPAPGWWTYERQQALFGQACEFILQRDAAGREIRHEGRLVAADLYFPTLGLAWEDWLTEQNLPWQRPELPVGWATAPIRLEIKVVPVRWVGLKAPALAAVRFGEDASAPVELVRIPPPEKRPANFNAFAQALHKRIAGKPAKMTLLLGPDGQPYLEIGQKRAARLYFPDLETTLAILMKQAADESAAAAPRQTSEKVSPRRSQP